MADPAPLSDNEIGRQLAARRKQRLEERRIKKEKKLRDYFAAAALATVSAYSSEDVATWAPVNFALHAYAIADAMLAVRNT